MPATFSIDLNLNVPKELLTVLQKIAEAITPKTYTVNQQIQQPQSPAEMAARQRVIPVNNTQEPAPTIKPQQPVYSQAPATPQQAPYIPQQYAPTPAGNQPMRQYRPAPVVPVNNTRPAAPANTQPVPQQAPVAAAPQYTQEQLARATATLVDKGRPDQVNTLWQRFNIQRMDMLPKERYGEYATALRGLGVKI